MQALLVLDTQNVIVNQRDQSGVLKNMETILKDFKEQGLPILFIQQVSDQEDDHFYMKGSGADIYAPFKVYADKVIQKRTPSAFYQTGLMEELQQISVDHVFIIGFNTEFCCMFTAIAAYDRGFRVTFLEEGTGTVNQGDTYEINNLDIPDFIGTVLHWSQAIDVLDMEEYEELRNEKDD